MSRSSWDADKAAEQIMRAAMGALEDAAEFLLEDSNRTAPIEESTLIRSGTVSSDRRKMRAWVSYDTPYARRQHEDTRLRHDPGRRAKWLQRTFAENRDRVGRFVADGIRKAVA